MDLRSFSPNSVRYKRDSQGMHRCGASSHPDDATQPAPPSKTIHLPKEPAIGIFTTRASLSTHLSTDDERRYCRQVLIAIRGQVGCEHRSSHSGRGQIGTRSLCGLHNQIHVLTHQTQRKFRGVVVVLDLLEFSSKCR